MHLYEILIPTKYGDTLKPIRTRHHKSWDAYVRKITGGLTILTPARGQWVNKGTTYEEKIIPVRIACDTPSQMKKIALFTKQHYRQKAVMYYLLSTECNLIGEDAHDSNKA